MNLEHEIPALDQVTKNEEQTGKYEPVSKYIDGSKSDKEKFNYVQKVVTNKLGQKRTIYVQTLVTE